MKMVAFRVDDSTYQQLQDLGKVLNCTTAGICRELAYAGAANGPRFVLEMQRTAANAKMDAVENKLKGSK